MFERTEAEILATPIRVWVDQRQANMISEFMPSIKAGWNAFTFDERNSAYALCSRMLPNSPKRHIKQIKGFMNALSWAYGPDYEL